MPKTIIGIDPGKGGGIAQYKNGFASAVAMPENVKELYTYLKSLRDNNPEVIAFLEKVQAFDNDDDTPGLKYGINKLLAQYEQCKTVLIICEIPFVVVYPQTWQSTLAMGKRGLSKGDRKNLYKDFANENFPEATANLKTADALCLVYFGMQKLTTDVDWVNKNIVDFPNVGLF